MSVLPAEVLWTARFDYKPCWKLELHSHKFFQMICIRSGDGSFRMGAHNVRIVPGLLVLIKPGQVHGLIASSLVRTLDLKFVVRDLTLKRALGNACDFMEDQGSAIFTLAEQIHSEGERKAIFFREICGAYLVQLLVQYLQQSRGESENESHFPRKGVTGTRISSVVRRAMDFISQHYGEDLDEQRLASSLGVSDRHLRYQFKESIEMPPMRYLACYRIDNAKELIKYSNHPLKVIAELCGFKSIHHFNHVFSQITGESPGAWRRRHREGICKDVCIDPHFSNVILVRRVENQSPEPAPEAATQH